MRRTASAPHIPGRDIGVGLDIIEIDRLGEALARGGERFLNRSMSHSDTHAVAIVVLV